MRTDRYRLRRRNTPRPDKAAIAERAVEHIGDRIADGPDGASEAVEIVTPFRLEIRESTTDVRAGASTAG